MHAIIHPGLVYPLKIEFSNPILERRPPKNGLAVMPRPCPMMRNAARVVLCRMPTIRGSEQYRLQYINMEKAKPFTMRPIRMRYRKRVPYANE